MDSLTKLLNAISDVVSSLDQFLTNHGYFVGFSLTATVLAVYLLRYFNTTIIKIKDQEIERLIGERNRLHDKLLENRKSSKDNTKEDDHG